MSCRTSRPLPSSNAEVQAFAVPSSPKALLRLVDRTLRTKPVYCYIVTTIETTSAFDLQQMGSAPNFAGGCITLCTCKHKDRATIRMLKNSSDPWRGVWVAGLTSKSANPSRSLAYLMYVERSFSSQLALWNCLPKACRREKSASRTKLGDLYVPKPAARDEPHIPANYRSPLRGHVHSPTRDRQMWHRDIEQWGRVPRPHRLLLGQAAQSYRWVHVEMVLKPNAIGSTAHHKIYDSLSDFIEALTKFDP
jgi:hypothetical protein